MFGSSRSANETDEHAGKGGLEGKATKRNASKRSGEPNCLRIKATVQ